VSARRRLDAELVRRGLAGTRSEAQAAIRLGRVTVGGSPATKPATLVGADEAVGLSAPARPYVSRGGQKLEAALDRFGLDPGGRDCLDAGASTGGFTDCLLRRGAARVAAVDVGYGQLDWSIRQDPRVLVLDRTNVRELEASSLPFRPTLVTADLSFISLRLALPALARVAADRVRADLVLLVKPQFEAGPRHVERGGVVRDPEVWRRVVVDVAEACRKERFAPLAAMASPLLGPAGNVEFPLHAARPPTGAELRGAGLGHFDPDAAVADGFALAGRPVS
jgi:23S rRNA (cytidine1920-2'-O)/16S rRNA (cytidine1409-2'-O)-methyltransferase